MGGILHLDSIEVEIQEGTTERTHYQVKIDFTGIPDDSYVIASEAGRAFGKYMTKIINRPGPQLSTRTVALNGAVHIEFLLSEEEVRLFGEWYKTKLQKRKS